MFLFQFKVENYVETIFYNSKKLLHFIFILFFYCCFCCQHYLDLLCIHEIYILTFIFIHTSTYDYKIILLLLSITQIVFSFK